MRVQTSDLWYLHCKLSVFRHYLWGQTVSEQQFGENVAAYTDSIID